MMVVMVEVVGMTMTENSEEDISLQFDNAAATATSAAAAVAFLVKF